jgi:hypothetical protein
MTTAATLEKTLQEMRLIDPQKQYFALTLLGENSGFIWSAFTHFTGWVDDNDPTKGEFRAASLIRAEHMAKLWEGCGEPYVVVNHEDHLWVFIHVGGHALVENKLARTQLPDVIAAEPSVRSGPLGFRSVRGLQKWELNRAPTPKQRMRILKRDGYKCRICGRSPADYSDIELHVHHIRPWARGGLTEDVNLITLCHTCHRGLEPHEEFSLFELIRPRIFPPDREGGRQRYLEGVRQYREGFAAWSGHAAE